MELWSGEQILFDVAANLFVGIEGVGGKLKITNQRIHFNSHKLNIQTGTLDIPLSQIAQAKKRNTFGLVPNGMSIITKTGQEFKLVVWKRDRLINCINSMVS